MVAEAVDIVEAAAVVVMIVEIMEDIVEAVVMIDIDGHLHHITDAKITDVDLDLGLIHHVSVQFKLLHLFVVLGRLTIIF